MKSLNIGITGVNPFDGNRGVGALSYSIVSILDELSQETGIQYNIYFIINSSVTTGYYEMEINGKKIKIGLLRVVSLFTKKHFLKLLIFFKDFLKYRQLDYIMDAGYGDSYSDIYGKSNFLSHNSLKRFFSLLGKKQMLLPQTIGPFFSPEVKKAALKAMSKMQVLLARDHISYELVKKEIPNVPSAEIIDMAFFMPYTKDDLIKQPKSINVGVGISKLLWNKRLDGVMDYKDDYRQLMKSIIESLLQYDDNIYIHLVPHVVCENDSHGNDYELCYNLYKEYHNPRIILAPFFLDPIKAKNYISVLDFFTGARMHACIAAFSSGVPVFPISYSRKFIGLFNETLKYKMVGDLTKMNNTQILKNLLSAFKQRDSLSETIAVKNATIVAEKYSLFKEQLISFLNS